MNRIIIRKNADSSEFMIKETYTKSAPVYRTLNKKDLIDSFYLKNIEGKFVYDYYTEDNESGDLVPVEIVIRSKSDKILQDNIENLPEMSL